MQELQHVLSVQHTFNFQLPARFADAMHQHFSARRNITMWQFDFRHFYFFEAECVIAPVANKMDMMIVVMALAAFILAERIKYGII